MPPSRGLGWQAPAGPVPARRQGGVPVRGCLGGSHVADHGPTQQAPTHHRRGAHGLPGLQQAACCVARPHVLPHPGRHLGLLGHALPCPALLRHDLQRPPLCRHSQGVVNTSRCVACIALPPVRPYPPGPRLQDHAQLQLVLTFLRNLLCIPDEPQAQARGGIRGRMQVGAARAHAPTPGPHAQRLVMGHGGFQTPAGPHAQRLFMGHGTWVLGHGAWALWHGAWALGHGASALGHGAWALGHGAWCMGSGAWWIPNTSSLRRHRPASLPTGQAGSPLIRPAQQPAGQAGSPLIRPAQQPAGQAGPPLSRPAQQRGQQRARLGPGTRSCPACRPS
jgi:hypothetical protein